MTAILSLNIELLQAMEGTEISPFKIRKVFSPVMKAGQSAEDQGKPYYTKKPTYEPRSVLGLAAAAHL